MRTLKTATPPASMFRLTLALAALLSLCAMPLRAGGDTELSPVARILDYEITQLEREFIPLAEAMPEDKYDFAPTTGEFKGVRTFGQQISHVAVNIYSVAAAILGEKLPPELGTGEHGPATLKTKDELVAYLKGAFAYPHKAVGKLTAANLADEVEAWWGKAPRL